MRNENECVECEMKPNMKKVEKRKKGKRGEGTQTREVQKRARDIITHKWPTTKQVPTHPNPPSQTPKQNPQTNAKKRLQLQGERTRRVQGGRLSPPSYRRLPEVPPPENIP